MHKVAIIGSGFSGLCLGIKLKEKGIEDFVILEQAAQLGGTWRDNRYPGCACDVESHLYSFSFRLNPNWSRSFSGQAEIWQYLEDCVDHYGIRDKIQFGACLRSAHYLEDEACWALELANGQAFKVQFLVTGTGGLSQPSIPELLGHDSFKGIQFHTADWPEDLDLSGKRIGIIGTGASAIQIVPSIVSSVSKLHLFQRTPAWVLPKHDRDFSEFEKKMLRTVPGLMRLYRSLLYWSKEFRVLAFAYFPSILRFASKEAKWHINKHIKDPALRKALLPNYVMGCKRILLSDDYYKAFNSPQLELHTQGIERITEHGISTIDGIEHELDVLIYATGFKATEYLGNVRVEGRNGLILSELWKSSGGKAYLGTCIHGFPNLFTFTGPNTGLGHSSVLVMIEAQAKYILDSIQRLDKMGKHSLEVRQEVQDRFNEKIDLKMANTVWQQGGCHSWYQDEQGRNPTLWPDFTFRFRRMTRRVDLEHYLLN